MIDGDSGIDACGRNPLELVRRASERTRVVGAEELLPVLEREAANGRAVADVVRQRHRRDAAGAAAEIVLAALRAQR